MAATVIASAKNNVRANAQTTGVVVTHGFSLVNGDVLYAFLGQGDDPGTVWASASGGTWTSVAFGASATGNDRAIGVLRRVVTNAGGEPSTYTFTINNNAVENLAAIVVQVRGASTSTPEDATPTVNFGSNDFTPVAVSIDTVTANALVLTAHLGSGTATQYGGGDARPAGAPGGGGYSIVNSEVFYDGTNIQSIFLEVAKNEDVGSPGTKSPGTWTGTADDSSSEWHVVTVAVRPLASLTIACTTATSAATAVTATVVPGLKTIVAATAAATATAPTATISILSTVVMTTVSAAASAVSLLVIPVVPTSTVIGTAAAHPLVVVPGLATDVMGTAQLIASAPTLVVTGIVTIPVTTATLTATAVALQVTSGELVVIFDTLQATATAVSGTLVLGGAIVLAASTNIAAGATTPTTAQLTPPAGKAEADFQAGRISDDTNPLPSLDPATGKYLELEWSVKASAEVQTGQVYEFR